MTTRIRQLGFSVPDAAGLPITADPGAHAARVVSLLAGRLDRWLWAGGQMLVDDPLSMRDANRGDAVTTLGMGALVTAASGTFNNYPYFQMPGASLESQFRLNGDAWPDTGYAVLMTLHMPSGTPDLYSILGRSGGNPWVRIDTDVGRVIWQQGSPGDTQNWIHLNEAIAPSEKVLMVLSYDANTEERAIYINSATAAETETETPNIDPDGFYTYIGGNNTTNTDMSPAQFNFGDFVRIRGPLHGTPALDRLRLDLMTEFASRYNWTLT